MKLHDLDPARLTAISAELEALADEIAYDPHPDAPEGASPERDDADTDSITMELWRKITEGALMALFASVAPSASMPDLRAAVHKTPEREGSALELVADERIPGFDSVLHDVLPSPHQDERIPDHFEDERLPRPVSGTVMAVGGYTIHEEPFGEAVNIHVRGDRWRRTLYVRLPTFGYEGVIECQPVRSTDPDAIEAVAVAFDLAARVLREAQEGDAE